MCALDVGLSLKRGRVHPPTTELKHSVLGVCTPVEYYWRTSWSHYLLHSRNCCTAQGVRL
jgi:hypothetical protein